MVYQSDGILPALTNCHTCPVGQRNTTQRHTATLETPVGARQTRMRTEPSGCDRPGSPWELLTVTASEAILVRMAESHVGRCCSLSTTSSSAPSESFPLPTSPLSHLPTHTTHLNRPWVLDNPHTTFHGPVPCWKAAPHSTGGCERLKIRKDRPDVHDVGMAGQSTRSDPRR